MTVMIEQLQTDSKKIVAFKLSGKLHDEDYKVFVPAVEAAVASQGKVRLLAQTISNSASSIMRISSDSPSSAIINGKSGWRVYANRLPRQA